MAIKLKADPTFKAKVRIPLPGGGESEPIELVCKHRTAPELKAFAATLKGRPNVEVFFDIVEGWDLTDAFTRENVEMLLDNYLAATNAIVDAYMQELFAIRQGN